MPQRFGEEISEEDAYARLRSAFGHVTDAQLAAWPEEGLWSDLHKRAMNDELAARGLPVREWTDEQAAAEEREYQRIRAGLAVLTTARLAELPEPDEGPWEPLQLRALADELADRRRRHAQEARNEREDRADMLR
ncbi:hypothetical protein SAMN04488074_13650 [Lentzea albidocapillata subsp. violacea]|uniref:Uncharacterized protein n=1 Tax=Lentzea albidocapillata subsp. violacea TaxID=128104 RepID=A0A1G9Z221_9PSEU|nr:hypothetical protein [Lentzea albidocapillata]SDN14763.1 hypothetical protein SAMN04488074_13650 [Lentzea albidocapillata subsp. violacea]